MTSQLCWPPKAQQYLLHENFIYKNENKRKWEQNMGGPQQTHDIKIHLTKQANKTYFEKYSKEIHENQLYGSLWIKAKMTNLFA